MSTQAIVVFAETVTSRILNDIGPLPAEAGSSIRQHVMSLANFMPESGTIPRSHFSTAVALALDLDVDSDTDAILSTLQRRLNAPAPPVQVEGFERDQLVKVCQHLTEHRQGNPAVTFHNAPDLVCGLINDLREAEHLRQYHEEHVGLLKAAPAAARQAPVLSPQISVDAEQYETLCERSQKLGGLIDMFRGQWRVLRYVGATDHSVDAGNIHQVVKKLMACARNAAVSGGRDEEMDQAVGQLADSLGRPKGITLYGLIEQAAKEISASRNQVREASVPVSALRDLIDKVAEHHALAIFEDGQPDNVLHAMRVMSEQLASLNDEVIRANENEIRRHIARANGGLAGDVWPALEEVITALLANQKPFGFDEAAQQMINQQQQADEALAAIGNILKLAGRV